MIQQLATFGYLAGYALVFALGGALWVRLFFPGRIKLRSASLWPALTLGALALLLTPLLQTPLQSWINSWGGSHGLSLWLIGCLLVLVSGLVQEGLKAVAIGFSRWSAGREADLINLGLAVGLGFGVWEAWQLVAWPLGVARMLSLAAVFERMAVIGLHIGAATISAYGFAIRRPLPFAALAALIHAVANFSILLYQHWVLGFWATEAYLFVASLAAVWLASWLVRSLSRR